MYKIDKETRNRYQKDYRINNTQLVVSIPNELAVQLKMQLKKDGTTYAKFVKAAIQDYLKQGEDKKDGK